MKWAAARKCDDTFGNGGGVKIIVTIVTTVTKAKRASKKQGGELLLVSSETAGRQGVLRYADGIKIPFVKPEKWSGILVYLSRISCLGNEDLPHSLIQPGRISISVRRTRSHRRNFCVQRGLGALPQQAGGRKCECVYTITLLAGMVCGYPHALLAPFMFKENCMIKNDI